MRDAADTGEAGPGDAAADEAGPGEAGVAEDAARAASWTTIFEDTIDGTCNTPACHSAPNPTGALNMADKQTTFDNLVGVDAVGPACGGTGMKRVTADRPDMSLLVRKIEEKAGQGDTCGDGMPQVGSALTQAEIDAVRTWIADGAPNS